MGDTIEGMSIVQTFTQHLIIQHNFHIFAGSMILAGEVRVIALIV